MRETITKSYDGTIHISANSKLSHVSKEPEKSESERYTKDNIRDVGKKAQPVRVLLTQLPP